MNPLPLSSLRRQTLPPPSLNEPLRLQLSSSPPLRRSTGALLRSTRISTMISQRSSKLIDQLGSVDMTELGFFGTSLSAHHRRMDIDEFVQSSEICYGRRTHRMRVRALRRSISRQQPSNDASLDPLSARLNFREKKREFESGETRGTAVFPYCC